MALQRKAVPGGLHFFISMETHGQRPVFQDRLLKAAVERHWWTLMEEYPLVTASELVVKDHVVHVLVELRFKTRSPLEFFAEVLAHFQAQVQATWKEEGHLWNPLPKVRRITDRDEWQSLGELMVQKLLGGRCSTPATLLGPSEVN